MLNIPPELRFERWSYFSHLVDAAEFVTRYRHGRLSRLYHYNRAGFAQRCLIDLRLIENQGGIADCLMQPVPD